MEVVIGGGPGGYAAAERLARLGREVTLVERDRLGGVCLNVGCIPSKCLISAGRRRRLMLSSERLGLRAQGVAHDMGVTQRWMSEVVTGLRDGVAGMMRRAGVRVLSGSASFTNAHTLMVDGRAMRFEHAVVATGSAAVQPPPGIAALNTVDSTGALALTTVPARLAVLGGGVVGMELAQAWSSLGSRVTVVELQDRILPEVDPVLAEAVLAGARRQGVEVRTGERATSWDGRRLALESGGVVEADLLLVAVGRAPLTAGLDLGAAGIEVDETGAISVDEACRTETPHILAIGDVTGGPYLAHRASAMAEVAAHVAAGHARTRDWIGMPWVVFTDPEVASVGMTASQAASAGIDAVAVRFPFSAVGRALAGGSSEGFVSALVDRRTEELLGVQIAGEEASELIAEAGLAVEFGARIEDVLATVHAHPTLAEGLVESLRGAAHRLARSAPAAVTA